MKEMAENEDKFDNLDMMTGYLASIACSLAVIADKFTEGENNEEDKIL